MGLDVSDDPDLLVGYDTSDDAAVYRVAPDIALISTVDYITPPVEDPYWFGQIAAANALSDVYAMGGQPLTALNLVNFPSKILDMEILKEILKGGNSKVREAGASMAGGHSVDDNEPKYGLAVTGRVHPDRILTNQGCRASDALVLTKPLGTGVLFNAGRSGKLPYAELESILPQVATLNDKAMGVGLEFDIHACTDITGFGILGHCLEMALGSGLQINLIYDQLPLYPNALKMYQKGENTGSNKANRRLAQGSWEAVVSMTPEQEELLFDPQTSGGLLLAVPGDQCTELLNALRQAGIEAARHVGEVVESQRPFVRVV
jgi:selenide,water dikinase